jgi:hypothetical protein
MAFDSIETPFGKSDRIVGGAATYIALSAANFSKPINQISVVGGDFPAEELDDLRNRGVDLEGVQIKKRTRNHFSGPEDIISDMNTREPSRRSSMCWVHFSPWFPMLTRVRNF